MVTHVRRFPGARPTVADFAAAVKALASGAGGEEGPIVTGSVGRTSGVWHLVGVEDVLAEYAEGVERAVLTVRSSRGQLDVLIDPSGTVVTATLSTRAEARAVVELLHPREVVLLPERPRVFIGHGPHDHWRLLADLLRHQHGIEVLTFESAARGGKSVSEVLRELVDQSSFAVLVHSRDYVDEDGHGHASDNVVYETGYFQALLGPRRAVVVREHGCLEYANVTGVNQIRFRPGDIAAAVGDVLAVLRREFPDT